MAMAQDPVFDSALALLSQGNAFIYNRCRQFGADIFQTRLMLKKTVCIQGAEAARQFYLPGRMTRLGAIPKTVLWSLQDEGSVATLYLVLCSSHVYLPGLPAPAAQPFTMTNVKLKEPI